MNTQTLSVRLSTCSTQTHTVTHLHVCSVFPRAERVQSVECQRSPHAYLDAGPTEAGQKKLFITCFDA